MLRRPKPGESEDDLLEFQRQFLAKKTDPSARVVSKPGDKRKTDGGNVRDTSINRDVVKLEGLPSNLPVSDPPPPTKKSRFKAAQEKKARAKSQAATSDESGEPKDVHDISAGTILAKIIERDTRSAQYSSPTAMSQAFPSVVAADKPQSCDGAGRKTSLFAQQFAAAPDVFGVKRDKPVTPVRSTAETSQPDEEARGSTLPSMIDGSGLSATFGKTDAQTIHKENAEKLAEMSQQEILMEQRKLLEMLDPKLVEFLKTRKSKREDEATPEPMPVDTDDMVRKTKAGQHKVKQSSELPVAVDRSWVHMDKVEHDKLQWMKDLPPPSAGHSKTGQQARFDFNGNLIPPGTDVPVNMGLHHHGDEPERAGYTLEELFMLARSSNIQQRGLALTTLARVVSQAKAGGLSELVQSPVFPSVLDAGVVFLVRWSLDDSVDSVVAAAVTALNALLVNQADELCLDRVFHWHQGHRVACQAPSAPESPGIKLPDVADEKPEETDAEIAKQNLVKALVYRMDVIPRLRYILEKVRPHAPTVIELLQILVRLARHSTQVAYQVYNHKGLMKLILDSFLPLSWNVTDVSQPLSLVYGVPLTAAMRLVRTLCQAGRNIAASLLSNYQLDERLLRFLADNPRTLELPESEAYGLQIEGLNTWKTCLSYGLADAIYIELYPKLVEQLRGDHGWLYRSQEEQTRLAALIGALETAVCIASTPKITAFKHSQDGADIETGRSEDEALPVLNWAHVEGLIQPVSLLVKTLLAELASSYQIKKPDLLIPSACLNFVATFYTKLQSVGGTDPVSRLEDVKRIYVECMQHWNSIGLEAVRSRLSQHSNILQPPEQKTTEQHASLPEYGGSLLVEEQFLPVISKHTPYNFLAAFLRLTYSMSKINKGLLMSKDLDQPGQGCASVSSILCCPDTLSYLRKIAPGKPSHLASNYFTKFENHLQYYILKIAALPSSQESLSARDRSMLHCVALNLLTSVHHGDEHLTHDLLSTCIFSTDFWREAQEDTASSRLEELSISKATPTHLRSATEREVTFTLEQLARDARASLLGVRSTYLMAFAHSETEVIKSRSHFSQLTHQTGRCFTSNIGECLLPKDWMFAPLIELYNTYASVGLEVQNVLSASQLDCVRHVLRWIFLMEVERPSLLGQVSITLKLTRIMCVFLTGNDMFLDQAVHCYMAGLLRYYTKPNLLTKLDFTETIPGLTSFYDLYTGLLQQYEAVSFGDSLFGCYILLPLQQRHSVQYRKALWTEYPGILRTLSVSVAELLLPVETYLEPEEEDVGLVSLYFQSLYSGSLLPSRSPVLYLLATHHVNRFIYTQGTRHRALKTKMVTSLMSSKNEDVKKHLLYYKKADIVMPFGMELYKELPPIRQKYLDSISVGDKT